MCEYCDNPNKALVTHVSGVSAFVGGGRLWLRYYHEKEDRTYLNAEAINYCPMCGRKLNEVNNG